MLNMKALVALAAAIQPLAMAQSAVWGQCEHCSLGHMCCSTDSYRRWNWLDWSYDLRVRLCLHLLQVSLYLESVRSQELMDIVPVR